MLGGDIVATRERLAADARMKMPTAEESARSLRLALSPGGGQGLHRPRGYPGGRL